MAFRRAKSDAFRHSRDWDAARRVLLGYRTFLRLQFKQMRRQGPMRLVWRAVRFFLNDHPVMTLVGVGIVALASWGLYMFLAPP